MAVTTENEFLAYGVPNGTPDVNGVPIYGTTQKGQKPRTQKTPRNVRRGIRR